MNYEKGRYYKNKDSVQEYIKLAKDVNGFELIKKLKQVLKHNAELLEIGTGPGSDWEILGKTYKVTGSDYSQEFLDHLETKYPRNEFILLDAISLNIDRTFDGIYSNKVLQHLTDEELSDSIRRQSEILNPNGIICHSFWKGEGSEVFKGLFVNYHSENEITDKFEKYFEIISISSYREFEDGDSILLLARKI